MATNGDIKQITLPQSSGGGTYNIVDQGARDLITTLRGAMVFKGTLGTNGTITSLPSADATHNGFTYKVITTGTYAGQSAKVGDTFVCGKKDKETNYSWIIIPSGDEPSGTVTNVDTGTGLTGGPITSTGTIAVDFNTVQAKLPNGQNDTYLHKNATTGNLEWSEVQGGASLTLDDYLTSDELEEIMGADVIWDGSIE